MIDEIEVEDGFSYEDSTHEYRNAFGLVRPSVTGILKAAGVFDYSRIDPQLLERKRKIGTAVHKWTRDHDESGREADDVMALYPEERGYAESYMRFLDSPGLPIEWIQIETPMLGEIAGFEVGGTDDRFLRYGSRLMEWDIKTVAARHPGWRLQLAMYAMMRSKRAVCSMYGRASLRLMKDGRKAKLDIIPPEYDLVDSATATGMIQSYVWRYNHGLI